MTEKKRDLTLDALKGVAIFLVMVGHVINLNHMADPYVYDCIKAVQMPLFMMVSGYLCGSGRRADSLKTYGAILKKRAISYLVPFFVWIVILYPLELLGAIVDTLFQLDYGLWFLMTLFLLTAMVHTAQLVSAAAGDKPVLREVLFWGSYGAMTAFVLLETLLGWEFLSPGLTRLYIPFYMAGYVVTAYGPALRKKLSGAGERRWEQCKGLLAAVCAVIFAVLVIGYDLTEMAGLMDLLRQILASFAGCYVIFWLCRRLPDGEGKRAAAWLGNYTLEIYALHFHFATMLNQGTTYGLYSWQGLIYVLVSFVLMSALTAGIIFLTKKVRILDLLLYGKMSRKRYEKSQTQV